MRFRVTHRDVPPEQAARRLGISSAAFTAKLPNLISRGFPVADPDTGNFDLEAIDRWCDARHRHLFGADRGEFAAKDARNVVGERLAAMRSGGRG